MTPDQAGKLPPAKEVGLFIQAIAHDERLIHWLLGLEYLSATERKTSIAIVLQRMRQANERPGLIQIVEAMEHPLMLQAILQTLRDTVM